MAHNRFSTGGSVDLSSFNFTPPSRPFDELSAPVWEEPALSFNENTLPPLGNGAPLPSTPERLARSGRFNSLQFDFSPPRHTSFPSARLSSSFSISQSAPSGPGFGEHNPIARFYHDSEQPWNPIASDPTAPVKRGIPTEFGRPNIDFRNYRSAPQTELESTDTGFINSESGYHTYSVKSTVPTEYSQDLGSQFAQQLNNSLQPFTLEMSSLPTPNSDRSESQNLARTLSSRGKGPLEKCTLCDVTPKCPSDFKKHMLKHQKPHRCEIAGCNRQQGFTTVNDLIRHQKSVHKLDIKGKTKSYKCAARDCRNPDKEWPRLDNFKQHIIRMHPNEDVQELIDRSELKDSLGTDLSLDNTLAGMDPTSGYDEEESSFVSPANLAAGTDTAPLVQGWNSIQSNRGESSQDQSTARRTSRSTEARSSSVHSLLSAPAPIPSPVSSRSNVTKAPSSGSLNTLADVAVADASRQTGPSPGVTQVPLYHGASQPILNQLGNQLGKDLDLRSLSSIIADTIRHSQTGDLDEQVFQALRRIGPLGTTPNEPLRRSNEIPARNPNFTAPPPPQIRQESSSSDEDMLSASEVMKDLQNLASLAKKSKAKTSPQARNNQQKICPKCRKILPRTCDMNKHMKRHTRPYGCTFPKCPKEFGSKNDWKRHENSQHFQIELYRCQIPDSSEKARYGHCASVFYSKAELELHLTEKHQCSRDLIPDRVKEARIGRNNQVRFWCGFCRKIIPLSDQGVAGWDERFNHIDGHFKKGERRDDWVDAEENKTKGEILREIKARKGEDLGDDDDEDTHSPSAYSGTTNSPSSGFSGRVSEIVNHTPGSSSASSSDPTRKRKAESDAYQAPRAPKGKEWVFYCCQCGQGPHSEKLYPSCLGCGHAFERCSSCTRKAIRAGGVELDVSKYQ